MIKDVYQVPILAKAINGAYEYLHRDTMGWEKVKFYETFLRKSRFRILSCQSLQENWRQKRSMNQM